MPSMWEWETSGSRDWPARDRVGAIEDALRCIEAWPQESLDGLYATRRELIVWWPVIDETWTAQQVAVGLSLLGRERGGDVAYDVHEVAEMHRLLTAYEADVRSLYPPPPSVGEREFLSAMQRRGVDSEAVLRELDEYDCGWVMKRDRRTGERLVPEDLGRAILARVHRGEL